MKEEIVLGLLAAIFWSVYVVILKIASKKVSLETSDILLAIGILIAVVVITMFYHRGSISFKLSPYLLLPVLAGVMWFLGIFVVNYGIKKGLSLSIMAPIYNMNTLFVALLSIFILKEDVNVYKVIAASILVTLAAIILS